MEYHLVLSFLEHSLFLDSALHLHTSPVWCP